VVGPRVLAPHERVLGGIQYAGIEGSVSREARVRIGVSGVEAAVIPFGSVMGTRAWLAGLNIIGLRRRGYDRTQIHTVRAAFRLLFRAEGVFADRVEQTRQTWGDDALGAEILAFIDTPSRRGLIHAAIQDEGDAA